MNRHYIRRNTRACLRTRALHTINTFNCLNKRQCMRMLVCTRSDGHHPFHYNVSDPCVTSTPKTTSDRLCQPSVLSSANILQAIGACTQQYANQLPAAVTNAKHWRASYKPPTRDKQVHSNAQPPRQKNNTRNRVMESAIVCCVQ